MKWKEVNETQVKILTGCDEDMINLASNSHQQANVKENLQ